MMTRIALLLAGILTLPHLVACRDATEPTGTDSLEKVNLDVPRRLTFSPDDDRAASWSSNGQFIYYTSPGSFPFSDARGVLFRIPMVGGKTEPLLPEVQFPTALDRWFTAPQPSPDGDRLAYVEMWRVASGDWGELCLGFIRCTPSGTDLSKPRLANVIFRVREPGSANHFEAEPSVEVSFEGVRVDPPPPGSATRTLTVTMYPFHQLYNQEQSLIFRPSWSPDGQRLVVSDGLRLLVWEVRTDQLSPIPGTEDGVHPAWSPDGEWIAFTRLLRGDPIQATCTHNTRFGVACVQLRTVYPLLGRRVTVVRPDGSESLELADGEEPAWTPDSDRLVFKGGSGLEVVSADGGAAVPVPASEGGAEPAVSPDGAFVAFSKPTARGDYDIWVTRLEEGGL